MTRPQKEVWTVEAEAKPDSVLRAAHCHPRRQWRVPRQPGWDEDACEGGDGGHISSTPPSSHYRLQIYT